MTELVFDVTQDADGGFTAEAPGESIFTEADTWDELRANVREAVAAFYFDRTAPTRVRLHFHGDGTPSPDRGLTTSVDLSRKGRGE